MDTEGVVDSGGTDCSAVTVFYHAMVLGENRPWEVAGVGGLRQRVCPAVSQTQDEDYDSSYSDYESFDPEEDGNH